MSMHDFLEFESLPCWSDPEEWFIPAVITAVHEEEYGAPAAELNARREAAKLACITDCPMRARLLCLDEGLQGDDVNWGIRGGYDERQRRAVVRNLRERNRRLASRRLAQTIMDLEGEGREGLRPR